MSEILNLSSICRCCHTDGQFKSLYEKYTYQNQTEIYAELLEITFNITIQKKPNIGTLSEISHSICDECIVRVRDATRFRRQVVACETKFAEYYKNEMCDEIKEELEPDESNDNYEPTDTLDVEIDAYCPEKVAFKTEEFDEAGNSNGEPASDEESVNAISVEHPTLLVQVPPARNKGGRPRKAKRGRPKTSPKTRHEQILEAAKRYREKKRAARRAQANLQCSVELQSYNDIVENCSMNTNNDELSSKNTNNEKQSSKNTDNDKQSSKNTNNDEKSSGNTKNDDASFNTSQNKRITRNYVKKSKESTDTKSKNSINSRDNKAKKSINKKECAKNRDEDKSVQNVNEENVLDEEECFVGEKECFVDEKSPFNEGECIINDKEVFIKERRSLDKDECPISEEKHSKKFTGDDSFRTYMDDEMQDGPSGAKKMKTEKDSKIDIELSLEPESSSAVQKKSTAKRKPKKRSTTGTHEQDTSELLHRAVTAVRNEEMSIYKASKLFNVPHRRLTEAVKNASMNGINNIEVRPFEITREKEELLVDWITNTSEMGFVVTNTQIIYSAVKLAEESNENDRFAEESNENNRFADESNENNRFAEELNENDRFRKEILQDWFEKFIERHPEVNFLVCDNGPAPRFSVTGEESSAWHKKIDKYLTEIEMLEVLEDPTRIFNCEETIFFVSKSFETGQKIDLRNFKASEDKSITLCFSASADGKLLPIVVIAPEKESSNTKYPKTWFIETSNDIWMTCDTFYRYIKNVFNKFLIENNIQKPVVLFLKGYVTHLSLPVMTFCKENGIILAALIPNSVMGQPVDAIVEFLDEYWKKFGNYYKNKGIQNLKRDDLVLFLKQITGKIRPGIIRNGFLDSGLLKDANALLWDENNSSCEEN